MLTVVSKQLEMLQTVYLAVGLFSALCFKSNVAQVDNEVNALCEINK